MWWPEQSGVAPRGRTGRRALRRRRGAYVVPALLVAVGGCDGGATMLVAVVFSILLAAVLVGRDRQRKALIEAETLRRAIASGQHRRIETRLRRDLALASSGMGGPISHERQWLTRAQLGGLLVAEWRLEEAAEVYGAPGAEPSPHLRALAAFGHHEFSVLARPPTEETLQAIRRDRDHCLHQVPATFRPTVALAWDALEGLCLVRMGRPRGAVPLLERGLRSLDYNPARVVYLFHLGQALEQLGDPEGAATMYDQAALAFPGTRLASEARARTRALRAGTPDASFRRMLPETPAASSGDLTLGQDATARDGERDPADASADDPLLQRFADLERELERDSDRRTA